MVAPRPPGPCSPARTARVARTKRPHSVFLAVSLSYLYVIRCNEPAPPGGRKKRGFAVQKSVHRIFGRTRATVLGAALLSGAALPAAGLWAGTASALPNPNCVTTGITVTCTFSYTGSAISWPVPAGITHLTVTTDGASGASATSSFITRGGAGGRGGESRAALTGIPGGTTLSVFPGRAASGVTGGISAGGHGGNGRVDLNGNSGGGGGASTVAISPFTPGHLLVVAGGGGGGAAENPSVLVRANGGNGGSSGSANGR